MPLCLLPPQAAEQLAEHWKLEAERQCHIAASARAETARYIKLLQDSRLAADEVLLKKEREFEQVGWGSVWGHIACVSSPWQVPHCAQTHPGLDGVAALEPRQLPYTMGWKRQVWMGWQHCHPNSRLDGLLGCFPRLLC